MDELLEIYLEASGGKYGDQKGIFAVRDHVVAEMKAELDRAERALKRAGYQEPEWKPPLGKAPRFAEKCPKCFDTGTIMMVGGPPQACDCKKEISTGKAFQMEPGTMTQDKALGVVMAGVDQVEALARVLREAYAKHDGDAPEVYPILGFRIEARAAIAHLAKRPEGLPTAEEIKYLPGKPHVFNNELLIAAYKALKTRHALEWDDETNKDGWQRVLDVVRNATYETLRPWLRDPVGCDCSAIREERDLLKVEYESRQIMINNVKAALEGRPFSNTLEGE